MYCVVIQLQRLSELEEMVEEQDNALGTASSKHHNMLAGIKRLKSEAEDNILVLKQQLKK